ncbi:aspartic proteinase 36 isoform X1 [Triticum aestivum]|uniref:aspartic proteinase 36 isoform X1 n=1 Tax=Triticum aestivum TaxID=4565 RepID=UPI0003D41B3F|nr:aspartic proteinase 36-like isoform X1 [Triticum aestivum]
MHAARPRLTPPAPSSLDPRCPHAARPCRPYVTRIQLGNPPKNFSVLIDTASIMSWVSCRTPGGSSVSSLPGIFDPRSSSTSSLISCSDKTCQAMIPDLAVCSKSSDSCEWHVLYGSGVAVYSNTTGYYISDVAHLEILNAVGHTSSAPATIIFGCSTLRSGELAEAKFDGILTFAPHQMSFSSQLHSQGLIPGVFSLCLKSAYWGGILVFGEILEEGIVYTSLLPSPNFFQLYLESIAVNSQELPIEPSFFRPSRKHVTIADSGISLTYLADGAYDPFINAITAAVSPHVRLVKNSDRCFVTSINIDLSFPTLTLHFAGGAVMKLKPNNYLRSEDEVIYCIAWKRNYGEQITVLGDIVLKDKIIVHDLENMLFGWMDFDCSRPVNVTSSIRKKRVSSGNVSSHKIWSLTGVAIIIVHILCHFDR